MPTLKNLDIRLKTMKVDNYTTIHTKSQEKQKKWHLQPQIGIGYTIFNKKPDVYVGIGIGIDL